MHFAHTLAFAIFSLLALVADARPVNGTQFPLIARETCKLITISL